MSPNPKQKRISLKRGTYHGEKVVWLEFAYDKDMIQKAKEVGGCWSQYEKSWYIIKKEFDLSMVFKAFKQYAWVDYSSIKSSNQDIETIERPRMEQKLPKVIPIEKIQEILTGISNIKHKTALSTIDGYGGGFKDNTRTFGAQKQPDNRNLHPCKYEKFKRCKKPIG